MVSPCHERLLYLPGQIEGRNLPIFYNSEHKDILTDCREFVKPKASVSGVEECRESRSLHQRVSRPTHTIHNETGRPKQSSYINCQPLYSSEVQSSYIPSYYDPYVQISDNNEMGDRQYVGHRPRYGYASVPSPFYDDMVRSDPQRVTLM